MSKTKVRKRTLTDPTRTKTSQSADRAQVEDYPWGFPKISCFLDSDDAFMVYRRFGVVYSRLLLSKQDEMSRLEARLLAMDRTDLALENGHYLMSRPLDVEREEIPEAWEGQSRVQLLEKMEKVALEYGMYCSTRGGLALSLCPEFAEQLSILPHHDVWSPNTQYPRSPSGRKTIVDLHDSPLRVLSQHFVPIATYMTLPMERPLANDPKAELLLKAQQLKALERPSNRDYRSVLSFMENDGGQLYEEDMEFIYEKEDLVTLRPGREYA